MLIPTVAAKTAVEIAVVTEAATEVVEDAGDVAAGAVVAVVYPIPNSFPLDLKRLQGLRRETAGEETQIGAPQDIYFGATNCACG